MQQQTSRRRSYQVSFSVVKDTFEQIREVVELQLRGSALSMLQGLFSEEVGRLCGPRYSRKQGQAAYRAGSDPGSVLLRGQRVGIRRPRVKQGGQEVALETYGALQGFDLLCERVMKHMLCGVSTRNYEPLLDEISGGLGLSRSSVSKAFVQGSRQALEELNGRDLSSFEWLAVMIDSIECVDRSITVALGITTRGKKIVMGLREGDTENAELCKDLLQSLIERGFPLDAPILFVLDGSKALRKAVRKVFGDQVPIQRCIRHKERNALSYLPKSHHLEFRRRWKMIHGLARYDEAKRELDRLIDWLMRICPGAAKSVEEAAGETLTGKRPFSGVLAS